MRGSGQLFLDGAGHFLAVIKMQGLSVHELSHLVALAHDDDSIARLGPIDDLIDGTGAGAYLADIGFWGGGPGGPPSPPREWWRGPRSEGCHRSPR